MEPLFGHDFGHVWVHTGRDASEDAIRLGARAFTVGADITFGAGRYAPTTAEGQSLLAHELTHVVQQASAGAGRAGALESEAADAARAAPSGSQVTVTGATAARLQRAPLSDAEILALSQAELEMRLEANAEESSSLVLAPETLDALDRERRAIQDRLTPQPVVPTSSEPIMPRKGVKTPSAPDAFQGIDYDLIVSQRLPAADTWAFYASNAHFNVGRALRKDASGNVTTLFYSASVKWPGWRGSQWIIGPDAIDEFMARADDFHFYTTAAPQDPSELSDWEREIHLMQMAVHKGKFRQALSHLGQSHAEKWSDDPLGTIGELLPGGGRGRPRPRGAPKALPPGPVKPPATPHPAPAAPQVAPKPALPPPAPKAAPAGPAPQPVVRESAGAAPPGAKTMKDPFTGKEGQVVATSKTPASQRTSTGASRAEFEAYDTALHKNKEIGIQRPGGVNQGGPDSITARRDAKGQIEVIVNDSTINTRKKVKKSLPGTWKKEVDDAVAPGRLDLGDPKLEAEIRQAVQSGRVRIRTQLVTTTPEGKVIIKDM
jgi:hypothetical protein